jgi:hypothetical protein
MKNKPSTQRSKSVGTREAVDSSIALSKDDKKSTWQRMAGQQPIIRWDDNNPASKHGDTIKRAACTR